MRALVKEVLERLETCLQAQELPPDDLRELAIELVEDDQLTSAEMDRLENVVGMLYMMGLEIAIRLTLRELGFSLTGLYGVSHGKKIRLDCFMLGG